MPERSRIAAFTFIIKKPLHPETFHPWLVGQEHVNNWKCLVVIYKYESTTCKFNLEVLKLDVCAIMHGNCCSFAYMVLNKLQVHISVDL